VSAIVVRPRSPISGLRWFVPSLRSVIFLHPFLRKL
jgi:hypothetical protein